MKTQTIAVLALVAAAAVAGAGELDLPRGKWWENDRVVQRVGLSQDQQQAISDLWQIAGGIEAQADRVGGYPGHPPQGVRAADAAHGTRGDKAVRPPGALGSAGAGPAASR